MEKTIKFVKFGSTTVVCGKNHAAIYGEFDMVARGLFVIYVANDDEKSGYKLNEGHKPERFHGTLKGVREYFTRIANA